VPTFVDDGPLASVSVMAACVALKDKIIPGRASCCAR
jgi:hypothetical protein